MSQIHPKVKEILALTTGNEKLRKVFDKHYLSSAIWEFKKKYNRRATLDDAQEIYNLYEGIWTEENVNKPARIEANRQKGLPIWRYAIQFKIDVYAAMCRFLEFKYAPFKECPDRTDYWFNKIVGKLGYYEKSAGDIMEEMDIKYMESFIIDNGLFEEWKDFIDNNKAHLNKWFRRTYKDYSHLAYNGVTDDF